MSASVHTRDRWATPQRVVDAVAKVLGGPPEIDLAASDHNAKAAEYLTEFSHCVMVGDEGPAPFKMGLQEGLFDLSPRGMAESSAGWAWLNPPYSRGNMERFTAWAAEYVEHGGTVALCHRPDLSTSWYQDNVLPYAKMLLLPSKRIYRRIMNNGNKTAIGVLTSVLVATSVACALIGVQGLLVALICLCAIECYMLLDDYMYDTAALIAMVAAVVMLGLSPVVWLGGVSVVICIAVVVAMITDSL